MAMIRRQIDAQVRTLGEDEVEVVVSTANLVEQDALLLLPEGCVLDNFRRNPIWLWSHDYDAPIGRAEAIAIEAARIVQRVRFAPLGISRKADEIRGLVKAGIVSAASIGFEVVEWEWIDPKQPARGKRVTRWVLYECSFVSVPADPNALVTARAPSEKRSDMAEEWKVGTARNLPIEDSDEWDAGVAAKSIFEHAAKEDGSDEFDPAAARRGFLVYDAAAPDERRSYKLPIAHAADGQLKVPKGALRAAASRLPQADLPDDVKDTAGKVLDSYRKKAGIGDEDAAAHARRPRRRRGARPAPAPRAKLRGMYGVGQLAYLLAMLGYAKEDSEIEASIEGDGSQVPAMLAKNLHDLGETLVAMTIEEVKELCDIDDDDDDAGEGLAEDEVAVIEHAATRPARQFRLGYFRARAALQAKRAGKALSAANAEHLADVERHHKRGLEHHGGAVECHAAIGEHHRMIAAAHGNAHEAQTALTEEIDKGEDCDLDRCRRAAKSIGRNLDAISDETAGLADEHEEMGDCHRGIARSIRAATRCLRAVDGHEPDAEDGDSAEVQDSDGVAEDEGARSAEFRRRQAEKLALVAA